jgi:hypothetical protein
MSALLPQRAQERAQRIQQLQQELVLAEEFNRALTLEQTALVAAQVRC